MDKLNLDRGEVQRQSRSWMQRQWPCWCTKHSCLQATACLSYYTKSPTHTAYAFQTKYILHVACILSVAYTLQRNIRQSGLHCVDFSNARRQNKMYLYNVRVQYSFLVLFSESLSLPLDIKNFSIRGWIFVCIYEWESMWAFILITDWGILPPHCHCILCNHYHCWEGERRRGGERKQHKR